jgi:LmeA-like phospholipid-binding
VNATEPHEQDLAPTAPSAHRITNRWVVTLFVLAASIIVLVITDRLAVAVAERKLAARIQASQHLSSRPHVTLERFPFLLQVLQGRYRRVDIASTAPIARDGVTISQARVQLDDVHIRIGDALHGTVRDIPVRVGTGTALITYPTLTALVHRYGGSAASTVTVTAGSSGKARLTGPLGLSLDVSGEIVSGGVRITPDATALATLPTFIRSGITRALATPIPLPELPFGVTLTSGQFAPSGLTLHATAHNSTFPTR